MLAYALTIFAAAQASGSSILDQSNSTLSLASGSGWIWVLSFNGSIIGGENIFWTREAVPSWLIEGTNRSYCLAINENVVRA